MNYIAKTSDQRLISFFYTKYQGIHYRTYENNKWTKEKNFISGVKDSYSVTISAAGDIYLFCQSENGDVILCQSVDGEEWSKKVILQNNSQKVYKLLFNGIIEKNGLTLIYNSPSEQEDMYYLMTMHMDEKNDWSRPIAIDKITPLPQAIYQFQPVSGGHFLIYYQTKSPEPRLCYREFTSEEIGAPNVFHSTGYQITDNSFLTTNNSVHVLYIVRGMFTSQLIYRKKDSDNFSNPYVIWEGQRASSCLLTLIKDKLYAAWVQNDQLYYSVSDNFGNSFSRPVKHITYEPLLKANYVSYEDMTSDKFITHELYVYRSNPHEIGFLPEAYDDFYPYAPKKQPDTVDTPPKDAHIYPDIKEDTEMLRNKLAIYKMDMEAKDKQIVHLTTLLQSKNEKTSEIQAKLKEEYKTLEKKLIDFEKPYKSLVAENQKLKTSIEQLERRIASKEDEEQLQEEEANEDNNG